MQWFAFAAIITGSVGDGARCWEIDFDSESCWSVTNYDKDMFC